MMMAEQVEQAEEQNLPLAVSHDIVVRLARSMSSGIELALANRSLALLTPAVRLSTVLSTT